MSANPDVTKPQDIVSMSAANTLTAINVSPDTGLFENDIDVRRKENGYNEVPEKKSHPVKKFLLRFWGASAWMLEIIMVLSVILGKYADLIVVSVLLIINAVFGYIQERRAESVMQLLRQRLQINSRVLRDSKWLVIPARDLVPGDIVRIRPGDIIPADVKLLSGTLSLDQSALTGESIEADKSPDDMLSSGSIVRRGEGDGVVVLTGVKTQLGRTSELVQQAQPKFHIDAVMVKVARWLFLVVGALLATVVIMSLLRGMLLTEVGPLVLILFMSAIPLSLPVMFTVSMAVGSKELAKCGVLVTRLSAVEDAATMDVLCVDKTGTITMNQLAVVGVIPLEGRSENDVLFAGTFASQESNEDPLDVAILAAAKDKLIFDKLAQVKRLSFVPFDGRNRQTKALIEQNGNKIWVFKGAVETIAQTCELDSIARETINAQVGKAALKGYRTLAVAQGGETRKPTLIGLITLYDPPRPDAKELIAKLRDTGVEVKMLTGDALAVASESGRTVGLNNIQRIADLKAISGQVENNAVDLLEKVDGLAEVYPEDKFIVVKHLQAAGHVTGMTGDGVNDAPALRQAEVGIAVSTSTDVAKGAASIVLTGPGLTNILALVEQGRMIYQRILTYIINKISRTILKTAFIAIAFMVTGRFVMTAFTILLLVFITDFAKISLSTDRVRPSRNPETWDIWPFVLVSVIQGILMVAESLFILWIGLSRWGLSTNENALYTFSFLTLLYFAAFSIVSARERHWFWKTLPSRTVLSAILAEIFFGTLLT